MADTDKGITKQTRPKRNKSASIPLASSSVQELPTTDVVSGPELVTDTPEKKERKSITLALKEDGSIDMESMREATKEKLVKALGASPVLGNASISPAETAFIYDGIGGLESWAAVKFFGVPPEFAKLFLYSQQEKEVLGEPTAKVLTKYMPTMSRWKDEAQLILTLYALHQQKIHELQVLMAARFSASVSVPRPNGPVGVDMERPQ